MQNLHTTCSILLKGYNTVDEIQQDVNSEIVYTGKLMEATDIKACSMDVVMKVTSEAPVEVRDT